MTSPSVARALTFLSHAIGHEETRSASALEGIQGTHVLIILPFLSSPHILIQVHTWFPTESLYVIQRRLDALQAIHPQRSALENAVMYTADAVDEELDAMVQTLVDPAEREVLHRELKLMTKLLEKLTNLEARRRSYLHSRSSRVSTSGSHESSSSVPHSQPASVSCWNLLRSSSLAKVWVYILLRSLYNSEYHRFRFHQSYKAIEALLVAVAEGHRLVRLDRLLD